MEDLSDGEELPPPPQSRNTTGRVTSARFNENCSREGIIKRFAAKVANVETSDNMGRPRTGRSAVGSRPGTAVVRQKINIFISYCWHSRKEAVHEMAKHLMERNDLKIWIDMQNITGHAYESMAKGIDEADVVLCFFSREYAESENCRREIEYAANKNKEILPICVQQGYKPDGWLLFIFKSQMRINYREGDNFQETAAKICEYVHSIAHVSTVAPAEPRQTEQMVSVNFKAVGIPFFSKSKYFSRPEDENCILQQMKGITENPDDGCLIISGDGGVGKTTTISRILLDDKNHAFFVNECNLNRAIWINCFDWRDHFDEKAFVDKIVNLAKEMEESDRAATFNSLQGITSYYKKKNLRAAFVLDDMFNYRLLQFFMEKQAEPPICFVVTRDAQTVIETNFGMLQNVEKLEEMTDKGIKTMLKTTFKLNKFLSEDQILRLAQLCCGLPLIASLIAARITNCEDRQEAKSEFKTLTSPQYKISDLRTQNRSFKTVSNLFTFSLDQMDVSLRSLYYAFLMFNPAESVSIFDLGVMWGFDLGEDNRCGLRGVCRAFEKRSLVRRVKKLVADKDDNDAEPAGDSNEPLDDAKEDRFLVHQMLYEAALEKAKDEYCIKTSDNQDCLSQVRGKMMSGTKSDSCTGVNILLCALKNHRRALLERIISKMNCNDLAALCLRTSPETAGRTLLHHLYHYNWQQNLAEILEFTALGISKLMKTNPSYRLVRKIFQRLNEGGGKNELLWRVIQEPQASNPCSSLFMDICDDAKSAENLVDRIPLLAKVRFWASRYGEMKWESKLLDPKANIEPIVLASFSGDLEQVTSLSAKCFEEGVKMHTTLVAARRGHLNTVRFLIDLWPDTIKAVNDEGQLPIMLATQNGHTDTIAFLYEKWPESLHHVDSQKRNAIFWAAKHGHLECVQFLFEKSPVTTRQQDNEGLTALTAACNEGHLEVVKFLVENRADLLEIRTTTIDACAFVCAASFGRIDIMEYLFPKTAKVDHIRALSIAATMGQVDAVTYLMQLDPELVKTDPVLVASPLMLATSNGHLEVIEILYGKCDDFLVVQGEKVTAMMVAATNGHLDIVQWLFYKNPDTAKVQTSDGETAMSIAEKIGHREIAQFLRDNTS